MQSLIKELDAILPQTQCGQCGYNGCQPYAEAMAMHNEQINRCPPGGVASLIQLAKTLHRNPASYVAEIKAQQKPFAIAKIREAECIGCTKCIQACPVDAIMGSAKQLHSIISRDCTGCELCIEPCPVDCIDIQIISQRSYDPQKAKARFSAKQQRNFSEPMTNVLKPELVIANNKQSAIQAAVARAKAKRAKFKS